MGPEDLQFKIKTAGDLKAAEDYLKLLRDQQKALTELQKAHRQTGQSSKELEDYFRRAGREAAFFEKATREASRGQGVSVGDLLQSPTSKTPGRLKRGMAAYEEAGGGLAGLRAGLGGAIGGVGAKLIGGAAGAAVIATAAKGLHEYADAEERVAGLDAALAQRGQLVDGYRERLQRLAQVLQEKTGRTQAEWTSALTTLVQSGATEENVDALSEATKNLAGLLGGDLQSAAMMVGKAINGNLESFTRLGIHFDENATHAQKLQHLWTELAQRGGGQLEARNDTLRGSFKNLKNASGDLLQGIGALVNAFVPTKTAVNALAGGVNYLASLFPNTVAKSEALKNATLATGAAMESAEEIVKRYAKRYEQLKTSASQLATELDRVVSSLKAQAQQENAIGGEKANQRLKQIEADEKSGRITPLEAAERRAKVKRDVDTETFNREQDARKKEIQHVGATSEPLRKQVDNANKDAADQKAKLEQIKKLQEERAYLAASHADKVQIAQEGMDGSEASKYRLAYAKADQAASLKEFDRQHGPLDIAAQEVKLKEARENAKKANAEVYPQLTELNARKNALEREQSAAERLHNWQGSTTRLDTRADLKEARDKERGEVKRNEDGSLEGSPAAVRLQRQIDAADCQPKPPKGSAAEKNALAARDQEIARLNGIIEAIGRQANVSAQQQTLIRGVLDRIKILESQNRNRP